MSAIQPGDTAEVTLIVGAPNDRREETNVLFIQSVREHENGALSIGYRYASNQRGISWSAFVEPENAKRIRIISRDPEADTARLSLIPG